MANTMEREMETMEKSERTDLAEQTRPGPVFTPAVDIFESDEAITVEADMPGVRAGGLKIDLRENVLTLLGDVEPPRREKELDVHREFDTGTYYRQFALTDLIDQEKISARLVDGVLRLELPKASKAKPRRIPIRTA